MDVRQAAAETYMHWHSYIPVWVFICIPVTLRVRVQLARTKTLRKAVTFPGSVVLYG